MIEKFIPCRKCNENGYIITKGGSGTNIVKECDCHKEWRLRQKAKIKYDKTFNNFLWDLKDNFYQGNDGNIDRLKGYLNSISNPEVKRCWQYWYGRNNTQKTTTACWLGKQLLIKGYNTEYILMKDLMDLLTDSCQNESAKAKVKALEKLDVLFIDEAFAKDKIHLWQSGIQIGYVDTFLRECYNKGVGIIFISNVNYPDIEKQGFSASIQSLVSRTINMHETNFTFNSEYGAPPTKLF